MRYVIVDGRHVAIWRARRRGKNYGNEETVSKPTCNRKTETSSQRM
jgi:hypothetical protein